VRKLQGVGESREGGGEGHKTREVGGGAKEGVRRSRGGRRLMGIVGEGVCEGVGVREDGAV